MYKYISFSVAFFLILLLCFPLFIGDMMYWNYWVFDNIYHGGEKQEPKKLKDIVIIAFDKDSDTNIRERDRQKRIWDELRYRHYHSQLIHRLIQYKVKAMGFDIVFEDKSPYYGNELKYNEELSNAIKSCKDNGIPIIIGNSKDIEEKYRKIDPTILSAVGDDGIGYIDVKYFHDKNIVRGLEIGYLAIPDKEREPGIPYSSLVLKMADKGGTIERKIFSKDGKVKPPIPVNDKGIMLINFVRKDRDWNKWDKDMPFECLKYYDVLSDSTGKRYENELKGKYVLIGFFVGEGLRDIYPVPVASSTMQGIEIHAHALNTIINKSFITPLSGLKALGIVIGFIVISLISMFFIKGKILLRILLVAIPILIYYFFAIALGVKYVLPIVEPIISILIIFGAYIFYRLEHEFEKSANYLGLPLNAYKKLEEEFAKNKLPCKPITFLFSDIRRYTDFIENNPADVSAGIMQDYYCEIGKIVYNYGGYISYYGGDAILAVFGFPLDDRFKGKKNPQRSALRVANEISKFSKKFFKEKEDNKEAKSIPPKPHIGIGIASGDIHIGNIGIGKRIQMSLVGPVINLAARLQDVTKALKDTNCIALLNDKSYAECSDIVDEVIDFTTADPIPGGDKVSADIPNKILRLQGVNAGQKIYAVISLKNY